MGKDRKPRQFQAKEPEDRAIPARIAITGMPGSGKSLSAYLLAQGFGNATDRPGKGIAVIETETGRSAFYKREVPHKVVPLEQPYEPEAYQEALEYCVREGYHTAVIDTMTHEHDDIGGVLDTHDRLEQATPGKMASTRAWGPAKAGRLAFIQYLKIAPIHVIMVFRAKEKTRFKGNDAIPMGWVHVGGDEYFFETQINICLSGEDPGVPQWRGKTQAEQADRKRPKWAQGALNGRITAHDGELIAKWLSGDHLRKVDPPPEPAPPPADPALDLLARMDRVQTVAGLAAMDPEIHGHWPNLSRKAQQAIKRKAAEVRARLGVPQ